MLKSAFKWVGVVVLPPLALLIVSYVGLLVSGRLPWVDAEEGPDLLTLLSISAVSGGVFTGCVHGLAPTHKRAAMVVMFTLLTLYIIWGSFLVYPIVGGIGIARFVVTLVGALVGVVACWNES